MSQNNIANPEQAALWNDRAGRSWAELSDMLDRLLAPFVPLLLDEIEPIRGSRILDIGCGAGALGLAVSGRGGRCLGADISAPLIEAARARAERLGAAAAEFVQADAQTHRFDESGFDALISRFGIMFFTDPGAAFRNLHSAIRPGGRMAFLAWRSAAENPFMTAAERAAAEFLPQLPARVDDGPGQFGFADPDRVRAILHSGGWREVTIGPVDLDCVLSEPELRLYARRMGPVGNLLPTLDSATASQVERRVDAAFRPWVEDGAARFAAACWLVTARA